MMLSDAGIDQKLPEQQACRTGADDDDLCPHAEWFLPEGPRV